jgi:indole-3-glycerol phosphate synthase
MRLAGADAVNLIVSALDDKDLLYLIKIASSMQLQTLATVTSPVQLERLMILPKGILNGVIVSNRIMEDFSLDESGEQALTLLRSEALQVLKEKHGVDLVVLVEGRVGIIERNGTTTGYLQELKAAGANGAIIGSGLAALGSASAVAQLQSTVL